MALATFRLLACATLACVLFTIVHSTQVKNCPSGAKSDLTPEVLSTLVNISDCVKPLCKLRRKQTTQVAFKFTPDEDVKSIKKSVHAQIAGIPFPFIGVDGTNGCEQISLPDGSKRGCPLKAGVEYLYNDTINVLEIYPRIRVRVQWALRSNNKDVFCFEVGARII